MSHASIQRIIVPNIRPPVSHYCHVTRAGPHVWVAGIVGQAQDGSIPADVVDQFDVAITIMDKCLKAAGAGAEHVVKVQVFMTDIKAVARLRLLNPTLRVSTLKDVLGPFRRAEDLLRYEEGLRRAGLSERRSQPVNLIADDMPHRQPAISSSFTPYRSGLPTHVVVDRCGAVARGRAPGVTTHVVVERGVATRVGDRAPGVASHRVLRRSAVASAPAQRCWPAR